MNNLAYFFNWVLKKIKIKIIRKEKDLDQGLEVIPKKEKRKKREEDIVLHQMNHVRNKRKGKRLKKKNIKEITVTRKKNISIIIRK